MRRKILLQSDSNARTTRIFLLVLIIGYLFFFTSNMTIPDKITSKEETTKINEVNEYMDGRSCQLLSATYDREQETMEVIVHLTNNTYDGIDSYYIAEKLNNGSTKNLVTREVLDDPLMTVIIMVPFVKTNFGTIIMCHYLPYMYHIFFYAAVSKLSPKTSAGVLYPNASCGL